MRYGLPAAALLHKISQVWGKKQNKRKENKISQVWGKKQNKRKENKTLRRLSEFLIQIVPAMFVATFNLLNDKGSGKGR